MTGTLTPTRRHASERDGGAPRPEVDPRIVRRRAQVRSDLRRRRRRILVVAAATVLAVAGLVLAMRSPLLDVESVPVTGTARADEVRRAAGVRTGDALIEVDAARVRRRVAELPWVASARVSVDWPRQVRIAVREEQPVALLRGAGRGAPQVVVAAGGRVVGVPGDTGLGRDRVDALPALVLEAPAVLRGADAGSVLPAQLVDAVVVLEQLPPTLRGQLGTGRVDRGGALSFELADGGTVRFGPPEDVPAKLLATATVLGGRVVLDCLDVVDVREPMRPTLSRRRGCTPPPPTSGPAGSATATGGGSAASAAGPTRSTGSTGADRSTGPAGPAGSAGRTTTSGGTGGG